MKLRVPSLPSRLILLLSCVAPLTRAADGDLLRTETIRFSAEAQAKMTERQPDAAAIFADVELQRIVYEVDGLKVSGYLAKPKAAGDYPCLVWNRGGNREFGAWNDRLAALVLGRAASWGYVVIATQYRGNAGGEGREDFGGDDVNDVLALLRTLEQVPGADATRVGLYGQSRGGMMAYRALTRTDRFAAAVIDAGMADLADSVARRPDMERVAAELIPEWATDRAAAIESRSAVRWAEKISATTPVLLLHGTADDRVDVSQAQGMAAALAAAGRAHELVLFEGGDHALSRHRPEADERIRAWFEARLRR